MTALNFDTDSIDAAAIIRGMARDDFDNPPDSARRLSFDEANAERGLDDVQERALEELGEDEAAEIYNAELDALESEQPSDDEY